MKPKQISVMIILIAVLSITFMLMNPVSKFFFDTFYKIHVERIVNSAIKENDAKVKQWIGEASIEIKTAREGSTLQGPTPRYTSKPQPPKGVAE